MSPQGRELQFAAYETSRCSSLVSEEHGRCQHDVAVNSRFGSTADSRPLDRSMSGVSGNCHRDAALEWQQLGRQFDFVRDVPQRRWQRLSFRRRGLCQGHRPARLHGRRLRRARESGQRPDTGGEARSARTGSSGRGGHAGMTTAHCRGHRQGGVGVGPSDLLSLRVRRPIRGSLRLEKRDEKERRAG